MVIIRHGDVILTPVERIPKGQRKPVKDNVLAYGEVTGHSHTLVAEPGAAELFTVGEGMYLAVSEEGVSLRHQEHAQLTIPRGDYSVTIKREYAGENIERRVAD